MSLREREYDCPLMYVNYHSLTPVMSPQCGLVCPGKEYEDRRQLLFPLLQWAHYIYSPYLCIPLPSCGPITATPGINDQNSHPQLYLAILAVLSLGCWQGYRGTLKAID